MALILAFDTAGPWCAGAVLDDDIVRGTAIETMERGQSERLMPFLEELLADLRVGWSDLDAVACGTGPGNLTGTRIAVATARGLALALGRPAIGVSRFEALALDRPLPCLVVIAARRGERGVQRFGDGALGPMLVGPDAPLPDRGATVVEDAALAPEAICLAVARIALKRLDAPQPRPAPLYLRPADAAPSRTPVPVILP